MQVHGVLTGSHLAHVRTEFDRVWDLPGRSNPIKRLQHRTFVALIAHPPILDRRRAVFGEQVQLLQYDFLRQRPLRPAA